MALENASELSDSKKTNPEKVYDEDMMLHLENKCRQRRLDGKMLFEQHERAERAKRADLYARLGFV